MRRIRNLWILVIVLALVLAASACGKREPVVIRILGTQYSGSTESYIQTVITAFEEKNPNVKVTLEIAGWDAVDNKIKEQVEAKQAPDLYIGGSAAQFVGDNLVYQAEEYVSDALRRDFYPAFWDNNIDPNLKAVYQIPYGASVRALYYNKTILEQAGISAAPRTWAEVEAACAQIYSHFNGEVCPWGIDAAGAEGYSWAAYYGWNNGGGYTDAGGAYTLNSQENVEALEWAYQLYQKGWTNPDPLVQSRDELQKMVASGKLAMLITANVFPMLYPDIALVMAQIPYNDANVSHSATLASQDVLLCFNSNAKAEADTPEKLQAIQDFLDFFYSPENYVPFMTQEGLLPATVSGAQKLSAEGSGNTDYRNLLESSRFYTRHLQNWNACIAGCKEAVQQVFSGQQSARDALDAAQAGLTG